MSEDLTTWADALEAAIARSPEPRAIDRVAVLRETASTQDAARSMSAGRPGLLVVCGVQTCGRGRLGRAWHDAPGKSLALSLTLDARAYDPALVSLGAGLAAARTGELACGLDRLGLRWPNDVVELERGRKLAGVLIERSDHLLTLGIGINVLHDEGDWPEELAGRCVSLVGLGSGLGSGQGSGMGRLDVVRLLIEQLESALRMTQEALCQAWGARDVLVGTTRTFESGGERVSGLVRSIAPTSRIVVECADGACRTLDAMATSLVHDQTATDSDKGNRMNEHDDSTPEPESPDEETPSPEHDDPMTGSGAPAPAGTDDRFRPLDPRAITLERIGSLIFTGIVTLGLAVTLVLEFVFDWWGWGARVSCWAGALLIVLGLLWLSIPWVRISHNATSYRVNDDGLEIRRGVLWRKAISVPRSRVQHTDVAQGPLQRRFGLGTLTVHTAATRTPSVQLAGLSHDTAMRIRENLRQSGTDDGV